MYKINVVIKSGVELHLKIPAKLIQSIDVEHPLSVGDVNGDGSVDVEDARLIMDHLAGAAHLDDDALARADVNGDGEVTYLDAMAIIDREREG